MRIKKYPKLDLSKTTFPLSYWLYVEEHLPSDDDTVLGINIHYPELLPIFCYFDEEDEEFYHVNIIISPYPIKITHWMRIKDYPEPNCSF